MSPSPLPWDVRNAVRLYLASLVGASLVGIGWYGASGTGELGTQLAWVDVAAVGVIVAGTGNVVWLVHGHRAVRARQRAVVARAEAVAGVLDVADVDDSVLVAVAGGMRIHRSDCVLVRGKHKVIATSDGRVRCEVCSP